ncbi:MAG: hypothetical protein HZA79_12600 [Sphingobacteriales bacterium]|nr:hypothetical protein [Sphingobacteriales bacterium]
MKRILLLSGLFVLSLSGSPLSGLAQTGKAFQYIKVDTTKGSSSAELVKMADKTVRQFYAQIYDAKEKALVDGELRKLENAKEDKLRLAGNMSSASALVKGLGYSMNTAAIFAAKPAALFPNDTLIVNNYGSLLRDLDSNKAALKVLLYAKKLCPNAPVILTNLGNTLFELKDDRSAEVCYKQALLANPDFAPAQQSLVSVYLKRRDLKSAMKQLFAGIRSAYCESMGSLHERLQYREEYKPDQSYGNPPPGSSGSEAPNPGMPVDQLRLPDFPNWPDAVTLINDNSVDKVIKKLGQISKSSGKEFDQAMQMLKASPQAQQAWYEKESRSGRVLYKKYILEMDLLQEYYEQELDKVFYDALREDSLAIKKMDGAIQNLTAGDEARVAAMNANPDAWKKFMIQRCKDMKQIREMYYRDWRQVAGERHRKYTDLLMTYWIYCEPYLNRCYDMNEFEKLNDRRKSFVTSQLSLLYTDYQVRQLGFAFQNIGSFATVQGDCPQMPPDKLENSNSDDAVTVPDKFKPDCPFEGKTFKIGSEPCSMGVDCESLELECTEGLAGAVKWNFKKKEISIFGGVGVSAEGPPLGFRKTGLEAKTGFEITFNTKGQVTDLAYLTEVSASGTVGGESTAGQKLSFRIGAMTGLNVENTMELSVGL